ncbi:MAG TPA: phage holin family protein [Polyangia bacterium]
MAILQALFALITRSAGKILNAIFGWAVNALFGRTTARDQTVLSAIVGAAVAWPLLAVGVAAPKVAAFALAFVPLPHSVPSWIVRLVWLALALAVPLALGLAIASRGRLEPREPIVKRLLRGFPLTLGLALAFIVMFVSVPLMRLVALARSEKSADVPLVTDTAAYHEVAALTVATLNRHGFGLTAAEPGWWVKAPTRLLAWFGGAAFGSFVPQSLEHYEAPGIAVSFYTSGVLLRGKGQRLTWAHGLIEETIVHSDGLQTFASEAQEVERDVRRIWKVFDVDPRAHRGSAVLLDRLDALTRRLGALDVEFDEWQVIYRQLLQLDRALRGEPQLLEDTGASAGKVKAMKSERGIEGKSESKVSASSAAAERTVATPLGDRPVTSLSTAELIKEVMTEVGQLARTHIELAVNEARADLRAEAGAAERLTVAALAALATVNLLLVTAVMALALVMPAWAAGLLVSGVAGLVAVIAGVLGWRKRVHKPMDRTRRELKEDVKWTKERMA